MLFGFSRQHVGSCSSVPLTVTLPAERAESSSPLPAAGVQFSHSLALASHAGWSVPVAAHTHAQVHTQTQIQTNKSPLGISRRESTHTLTDHSPASLTIYDYSQTCMCVHVCVCYLSPQSCSRGREVYFSYDRCSVRGDKWAGVTGCQKQTEILIVIDNFISNLHHISRT